MTKKFYVELKSTQWHYGKFDSENDMYYGMYNEA
jgi:hypothetical protein